MTARRRWAVFGASFAVLFAIAFVDTAIAGINVGDEAWFLQVVTRTVDGAVLYRDTFFNTTPLSVELTGALVALFGSGILIVKALTAAAAAATSLSAALVARHFGAERHSTAVVALSVVLVPGTTPDSPYSFLAVAFLAICLACTLAWRDGRGGRFLVAAAGAAGLSLSSKHSTGLAAFAALGLAVLLSSDRVTRRQLAGAACAAAACALLPVLPVLAEGGGAKLVEYALSTKGTYVTAGSISYLDGLSAIPTAIGSGHVWLAVHQLMFLLPLLVLPLLAAAVIRRRVADWESAAILAAFVCAALTNVYPRADLHHLDPAIPLLILGLWFGARAVFPIRLRRAGAASAIALLALAVAATIGKPVRRATDGELVMSRLPHFRGVLVPANQQVAWRAEAAVLDSAARDGSLFILSPDAGFRYLISGARNMTPFDYPLVTTFGVHGRERIRRAIADGRITFVCVSREGIEQPLWPQDLEAVVARTMRPYSSSTGCKLFRRV